jgi:hypothetical protein
MPNNRLENLKSSLHSAHLRSEYYSAKSSFSIYKRIEVYYGNQLYTELSATLELSCENTINQRLKEILDIWWNKVKGTYLSYTSIPNSDISKVLCLIAKYLSDNTNNEIKPITFLMPTIKFFINCVSRENINELSLEHILQTHILSSDYESLIPISLFAYLQLESSLSKCFINPFTESMLSVDEIRRLSNHSFLVKQLISAKQDFDEHIINGTSLYKAITQLISGLYKGGSLGGHGGTSEQASAHAYIAIIEFRACWSDLTPQQIKKAFECTAFKDFIQTKLYNPNWRDECVGGVESDLEKILTNHRDLFLSINLTEERFKNKFIKASKDLNKLLESTESLENNYDGRDQLTFTIAQAETVIKLIPVHAEELLNVFRNLKVEEILLTVNSVELIFQNISKNSSRLNSIILNLIREESDIYYHIEDKVNLATREMEKFYLHFTQGINSLSDELAIVLLNNLPSSRDILSSNRLRYIIDNVSVSKQKILMPMLTSDISDCGSILRFLPSSRQMEYLESINHLMNELINSTNNVTLILISLTDANKILFLQIYKDNVIRVARKHGDRRHILSILPENQKIDFICDYFDEDGMLEICEMTPEKLRSSLFVKMENNLKYYTKSIDDFLICLKYLSPNNNQPYLDSVVHKLPLLTRHKYDFAKVLLNLAENMITPYLSVFDPKMLARIAYKSAPFVFTTIYNNLPAQKINSFINEFFLLAKDFKSYQKASANFCTERLKEIVNKNRIGIDNSFLKKSHIVSEMIFRTYKYQTEVSVTILETIIKSKFLRDEISKYFQLHNLNLSKDQIKTIISSDKNKFNKFVFNVLPDLDKSKLPSKMKYLTFQYDYSLKILNSLKEKTPQKSISMTQELFKDKRVRFQLEKSHNFWGWLLQKLGLTTGQKMLKFFDKSSNALLQPVQENLNLRLNKNFQIRPI